VISIGPVLCAVSTGQVEEERSMPSAYEDIIKHAIEEAWNKGNVDVLDQVYAPDCVSHEVSPGGVDTLGVDVQREHLRRQRAALSGFQVTIEDVVCGADRVAFRWVVSGTHKGDWMGIAPTGRRITWGGITICRFANGKIVEEWLAGDMLTALMQLGVLGSIKRVQEPLRPPQLELLGHRGRRFEEADGYRYVIEGQVKSLSDLALAHVEVAVTMYDENDRFLSSERSFLASEMLQPGEVSPFAVHVARVGQASRRYEIQFEQRGHIVAARDSSRREQTGARGLPTEES